MRSYVLAMLLVIFVCGIGSLFFLIFTFGVSGPLDSHMASIPRKKAPPEIAASVLFLLMIGMLFLTMAVVAVRLMKDMYRLEHFDRYQQQVTAYVEGGPPPKDMNF